MFTVCPMTADHVDEVWAIEERSFSQPWSKDDILGEISRKHSCCFVVLDSNGKVAGYAGMWHIINEGQINNIAVDEPYRRQGAGALLMEALIKEAAAREMIGLTLEVRIGNKAAMAMYHKFGFVVEGYRRGYYQDPREDAAIMWKYL